MKRKASEIELLSRELYLERELFKIEAQESFPRFLQYMNDDYRLKWFHRVIAENCQRLLDGEIQRLMIFVPPQHGKSEITSRNFPAFAFGKNPNLNIVGASYASDLAQKNSRAIQRFIDSESYSDIFPESYLNSRNIRNDIKNNYIRNVDNWELVNKNGSYKCVGVCGALTGNPADIAIIDDPVKDAIEAYSEVYRERVWDWYVNVLSTRLHNDSRQILIMTRWHDDDLAGRLLKAQPGMWKVVSLASIKETHDSDEYDPREIGEALWEEKHSLESLNEKKALSERTFASLYQQRPSIQGGNIIKSDWFQKISYLDFTRIHEPHPTVFFVDTAFSDKKKKEEKKKNTSNDPTGLIATCKIGNDLYISSATKVMKKFPDLIRFIPTWVQSHGYDHKSTIRIEPKANGISVIDQLRESTHLNVTRTPSPTESKGTRLNVASPAIESGRVFLVDGSWNDEFITEICGFPSSVHDEYVDLICYAIDYHKLGKSTKKTDVSGIFF